MEQFADELFGDGYTEYPLLLRPLYGTVILVIQGSKFFFYFFLPAVAAYAILMLAVALLVSIIIHIADMAGENLRKNDDGTRKKSDDNDRAGGSVERRLEAGEIKF
ncbi:hypothetical protein N7465_000287 [Penicillium sp. CMV-2018d]|nr:hypothetical protein N7465_000287 [Penicillium sp. CMV-2018d]